MTNQQLRSFGENQRRTTMYSSVSTPPTTICFMTFWKCRSAPETVFPWTLLPIRFRISMGIRYIQTTENRLLQDMSPPPKENMVLAENPNVLPRCLEPQLLWVKQIMIRLITLIIWMPLPTRTIVPETAGTGKSDYTSQIKKVYTLPRILWNVPQNTGRNRIHQSLLLSWKIRFSASVFWCGLWDRDIDIT